jgi:UDP-N-acetyl-D-mannosaminuronate dehydrogenase
MFGFTSPHVNGTPPPLSSRKKMLLPGKHDGGSCISIYPALIGSSAHTLERGPQLHLAKELDETASVWKPRRYASNLPFRRCAR